MNGMKRYHVTCGNYSRTVSATTAGKAKYAYWLDLSESFDVPYTALRARVDRRPPPSTPDDVCSAWNARHSVGTSVRYWTGLHKGPGRAGVTTTSARPVSRNPVVWCSGHPACISLTHVEVQS